MTLGIPADVKVGPGWLYANPDITADEPDDLTTAWATVDSGWVPIGYTDSGSTFDIDNKFEDVDVAEEFEPVDSQQTSRIVTCTFMAAQMTKENLVLASNGGTLTTSGSGATRVTKFEPPAIGGASRIKLGWESLDAKERWVWHECLQTDKVSIERKKAPNKATIPMSFRAYIPSGGGASYFVIFADPV